MTPLIKMGIQMFSLYTRLAVTMPFDATFMVFIMVLYSISYDTYFRSESNVHFNILCINVYVHIYIYIYIYIYI